MVNPRGSRRKTRIAASRAWTRESAKREAQGGDALGLNYGGCADTCEGVFAVGGIGAGSLDVQETSVGLKADLPQRGEVAKPAADGEVPVSLIVHSVRSARRSFAILLDPCVLVVDV